MLRRNEDSQGGLSYNQDTKCTPVTSRLATPDCSIASNWCHHHWTQPHRSLDLVGKQECSSTQDRNSQPNGHPRQPRHSILYEQSFMRCASIPYCQNSDSSLSRTIHLYDSAFVKTQHNQFDSLYSQRINCKSMPIWNHEQKTPLNQPIWKTRRTISNEGFLSIPTRSHRARTASSTLIEPGRDNRSQRDPLHRILGRKQKNKQATLLCAFNQNI